MYRSRLTLPGAGRNLPGLSEVGLPKRNLVSVFDGLRARLDRLFAEQGGGDSARAYAAGLRDAVVEAKAAVSQMRDLLGASERDLATERRQLEDAERRGQLAAGIADAETAAVADRFATRHRERVGVLERKIVVQRDELALAERELEDMMREFRGMQNGAPPPGAPSSSERAWRDIEAAGGTRPEHDLEGELLKARADRRLHEQAVEAQLAHLKKKLGRND